MILRITAIVAALILVLALVACPKQTPPDTESEVTQPAAETTGTPEATTPPVEESIPEEETPPMPEGPMLGPGTTLPEGWPTDLRIPEGFEIVNVAEPAEDGSLVLNAKIIEGHDWVSPWDISDYYTKVFRGWAVTQEDSLSWVRTDFGATIPLSKDNEKVLIVLTTGPNNIQEMTLTYTKTE